MSKTKTVDTTEYQFSHGKLPRGRGGWIFENLTTGDRHEYAGTYGDARKSLPAGTWKALS